MTIPTFLARSCARSFHIEREFRQATVSAVTFCLTFGQFPQHRQRLYDRGKPHLTATDVAEFSFRMHEMSAARGGGKMDESDRLAGNRAAWAGNAGNRYGQIDRR